MYDLPSGEADVSGTLVDLIDDEDLEMMWEEMDVMLVSGGERAGSALAVRLPLIIELCSMTPAVCSLI